MDQVLFRFASGFPLDDVSAIAARLHASGDIIPGYISAPCGPFAPQALVSTTRLDQLRVIVLPDLNIVSRMAAIARDGVPDKDDEPTRLAIDLMALCQTWDLLLEPSVAFHELASSKGNAVAHEKLAWFRAADRNAHRQWIDLAMRRRDRVDLGPPDPPGTEDLAFPLMRFRRNYIVALKIAALELGQDAASREGPTKPLDKALALLNWMHEEFMLAGPAAIFGAFYFSPTREKRLIKHLSSQNRERAVAGVANAAWDMTHLSDFVLRASKSDADETRVLLATADKGLGKIAPVMMSALEPNDDQVLLIDHLRAWWPEADAVILAEAFRDTLARENHPDRPPPKTGAKVIDDFIAAGEALVRAWRPKMRSPWLGSDWCGAKGVGPSHSGRRNAGDH